jgi:hypothetical protein
MGEPEAGSVSFGISRLARAVLVSALPVVPLGRLPDVLALPVGRLAEGSSLVPTILIVVVGERRCGDCDHACASFGRTDSIVD